MHAHHHFALALLGAATIMTSMPAAAAPPAPPAPTPNAVPAPFTPDANLPRASVPDGYKWDLKALFRDAAAFEAGLRQAIEDRSALTAFRGKLSDPAQLRACLDLYFRVRLSTRRLTLYAMLGRETDQKSAAAQSAHERSQKAYADFMADTAFVRRELLGLDDKALAEAYRKEPALAPYRPYLDELRRRRTRVLDEQAERVLGLAGDVLWAEIDINELPSDYERIFQAALADLPLPSITDEGGKPVQLTLASYGRYRASEDRRVRRDTVEKFYGTLKTYRDLFAGTLGGQVRFNVTLARARGYSTALDAFLDKDRIDPAVYRSLIAAVHQNLKPLHRYVAMRKRVMGLDELHGYDLYAPIVPAAQVKLPYAEAVRVIPEALAPLGEAYLKTLRLGLDPKNGWIDVYPHQDKESGAEAVFAYGLHPYVKMNYQDDIDDVSTLAHEFGHALHSWLSMAAQPVFLADYPAFIAEIASTFNEKLLFDYLLAHAKSDDERLYLLNNVVETIRTTIYRQTMFAEFELAVHTAAERGEPITADFLEKTYAALVRTYYGKDFTLGTNDGMEWAYIPHFYYKYYVYAYATGLSAGIALAERVQKGGPTAREAYLGMLRAGSSKAPLDAVRDAGVDLTRPDAVAAAARLMDRTLAQMEKILARRKPAPAKPTQAKPTQAR